MRTKKEIIEDYNGKLFSQVCSNDTEIAHGKADDIICELLREPGYGKVVDEYEKVEKWYT